MAEKKGAGGKPQEFDEESGRYGSGGGSKEYRQNTSYEEILRGDQTKNKPVTAYGFSSKERKNTKSHQKHAHEMGFKHQDEYEQAAVEFFNSDKGKLYFNPKDKRYYRYDEKTRTVAVCDAEGNIHTFFVSRKGWINTLKELEDV